MAAAPAGRSRDDEQSSREVVASARRGAGKEGGGASGHGRGGLEEKERRWQAWPRPWRATVAGRCTAMAVLGVRAQAQAGRASECQRELGLHLGGRRDATRR